MALSEAGRENVYPGLANQLAESPASESAVDEDLAWIERQIERTEHIEPVSEDAAHQQREYLGRLRRIRRELLREGR